jgi:soluble lytic murein transglycosylase-like protein
MGTGQLGRLAVLVGFVAALSASLPAAATRTERASSPDEFPALPLPPEVEGLYGLNLDLPAGRDVFLDRLVREAERLGLPPALVDAVAAVESAYDPSARGAAGEVGLMQVLPSTAAMLGHRGEPLQLFEPDINIRYGVLYLAGAWMLADGDLCRALMKYRAGHGEERMTPLSIRYCARARAHLTAVGSPLANAPGARPGAEIREAIAAALRPPGGAAERMRARSVPERIKAAYQLRKPRTTADSRRFWAAHEARIRAITAKLSASRLRIMSGS